MNRLTPALCSVVLLFATGCGNDGRLPCHPVGGTITVNGQPVKGLRVWLVPEEEALSKAEPPVRPYGECDEQGKFTSTTYTQGDGAPAGKYVLFVEATAGMLGGGGGGGEDEAEPEPAPVGKRPRVKLNPKYMDPKKSGLTVVVEAKSNVLTHDLK